MFEKGIYLPPSQFEALFVSAAHTDQQIDETIRAAETVLNRIEKLKFFTGKLDLKMANYNSRQCTDGPSDCGLRNRNGRAGMHAQRNGA